MDASRAGGITRIIELGPGEALARMGRDTIPGVDAHSLAEFHSLAGFSAWANGTLSR
jgi:[acyl-carrier-protein] S-malonyltransferase